MKKIVKKCLVLMASVSILGTNLTPVMAATGQEQEISVSTVSNESGLDEFTDETETLSSSEVLETVEDSSEGMESESQVDESEMTEPIVELDVSESVEIIETTETMEISETEEVPVVRPYKEIEFDYTGKFQREDGTTINSGETVGIYEDTRVEFEWSIPDGQEIKKGDTMTFDFPEQLKATGKAEFPLKNPNGDIIGNAKIDPETGKVTVTFTDYYEKNPEDGRHGTVGFTTKWKDETINVEHEVPLEIGKDGEIIVTVVPPGENDPNEILQKWGETIENGTKTSWIVRLNFAGKTIKNAVYTDTLGSLQEMIPEEIFGYYGYYDANGSFVITSKIPHEKFILTDTGFSVELGDLEKPSPSVEIYYHTKNIDEGNSPHYENSGKLTGSNIEEEEITVQTPETGNSGSGTGENRGIIKVKKVDSTDETKTLAGAEFDIKDKDGKIVGHIVTDENGLGQSKNLEIGDYTLVETKAPDGYELDKTPIPVKIKVDGEVSVTEITISNKPTAPPVGSIKIIKVDDKTGETLADAEFDVKDKDGNIVGHIVTDENGKGRLGDLELGDYTIIETKAPEGYEVDPTPIEVSVIENEESNTVTVTVENTELPKKGTVEIIKVDDKTGETLAGAEFDVKDKEGKIVGHIVTDENGKGSLGDLELGDYTIIETKAPKGYEVDPTPIEVSVIENEELNTVTVTVENTELPKKGTVEIIKVDDKTGETLAGAEFDVKDKEGKIVGHIVTDENGKGSLGDLELGDYTIIETKAPKGYDLSKVSYKVTLVENDTNTVSIEIENSKIIPMIPIIPGKPVIPWKPIVPSKPIIPNKPVIPNKPIIPNKPVIPTKPIKPVVPIVPTKPVVKLPQTGEVKEGQILTVLGLTLIGLTSLVYKRNY